MNAVDGQDPVIARHQPAEHSKAVFQNLRKYDKSSHPWKTFLEKFNKDDN